MRKLSTKDFIERATKIHKDKYDYSAVIYVRWDKPISIICPKHGIFQQTPNSHLSGSGCSRCTHERTSVRCRKSNIEFISQAKKIHGERYDYSKVEYIGNTHKVCIICRIHGDFYQKPTHHINGVGCPTCAINRRSVSTEDFISRATKIHNKKYDYSEVYYINSSVPVKIVCQKHGVFKQKPKDHLTGRGCMKCFNEERSIRMTRDISEFMKIANSVHDYKYDYSESKYIHSRMKLRILCPIHGHFDQRPVSHCQGAGCPKCSASSGELKINKKLKELGVEFIQQHKFENCRNIHPLFFDFFIPSKNLLIEYDGEQHFRPIRFFGGTSNFNLIKHRDLIKTEYALLNNIKLLRIPYTKFNDIEKILIEALHQASSCVGDTTLSNQQ